MPTADSLSRKKTTTKAAPTNYNPGTLFYKSGVAPSPAPAPATASLGPTPNYRAPAPVAPSGPSYSGGGGPSGGGPSGGGGAPAAPAAPPPPPPMADVDWFNQDSIFRNQASLAQSDLVDQLSNLLFQRNQGYQAVDNSRRDWTTSRDQDQSNLSEDYAARGLTGSGLYSGALDRLLKDYETQAGQINQTESDLGQQLGQRGSLDINAQSLFGGNGGRNALDGIFGLLGQRGVQAGSGYNKALMGLYGASADRANQELINTLGW